MVVEDEFFNFYDNRGISSLDERAWKAPRTADDGRTSSFSSAVHQEVVSRKSISKSRKSNTSENSKQGKVKRNAAEADRFIGTKERLEIRSDCRDGKARIDDEALKWLHQLSDDVTLQSNAESSPNHLRNPESNASPWNGRGESNCFQEDIGKSQLSLLHASNNVLSSSTRHFVQNGQEFAENPEIREETALLNCSRAELESIEKCTALVSRNAKEVYAVEETQPVEIPVAEYDEFRIPGPAGELIHHQDYGFDETVQILNLRNSGEDNKKEFHSGPWVSAMDVLDAKMVKGSWSVGWTTFDYLISEGRGGRVEQVVGIVSSFQPTDFGDAQIELKDHTGNMKAMIPSRIFNDEDVQERLTIGAVLVLKGPVVFSPQPGKQYLNITERNIVHIFPADKQKAHQENRMMEV